MPTVMAGSMTQTKGTEDTRRVLSEEGCMKISRGTMKADGTIVVLESEDVCT